MHVHAGLGLGELSLSMYWPSRVILAVCVPSDTINVPLVLPAASRNARVVAEVKAISRKSM